MRAFLASLAVAATLFGGAANADGFKRITTQADYVKLVVGKTYCNETGCWKARKNGSMTGKFGDKKFKAKWKWSKGFSCRAGTLGKAKLGTDCQVIEVNGNQLRVTRKQGRGKQAVYTAK